MIYRYFSVKRTLSLCLFFAHRLNRCKTCPDCRKSLGNSDDMKSVYLCFMSNDAEESVNELVRVQNENKQVIRLLKDEMKEIAKKLKTEKSKNTRLTKQVGTLSETLKNIGNFDKSHEVKPNLNDMSRRHFLIEFCVFTDSR